jgi:hypothetical protein
MKPAIYNLKIAQGASWSQTFYFAALGNIGLLLQPGSAFSCVVDGTAKTFTRNDGGSWSTDGLVIGSYLVNTGFTSQANNGSHHVTAVSDLVLTCAGDTLVSETATPTNGTVAVLKAMDLTGYTGESMIRKGYLSPSPAATVTVVVSATPQTGAVTASLTDTQTAAIPTGNTRHSSLNEYVWDLYLKNVSLAIRNRALMGDVCVSPGATHA